MLTRLFLIGSVSVALLTSCSNDDNNDTTPTRPYTVPTTYSFANANFTVSATRNTNAEALRAYVGTAQSGSAVTTLDAARINTMWNGVKDASANAGLIKAYLDSISIYNTATVATQGNGGYLVRGSNKIIVGPRGLEYVQGYVKGYMSTAFFKEAVRLLTAAKSVAATDTTKAQGLWDEAFGNLGVAADYDSATVYPTGDPKKPLFWGGYLAERGRPIAAGGTIFSAFLKGRAAIGGYDTKVRNEQADIIIAKWEQLAARSALVYSNMPTLSSNVGNLAAQFHALSECFGFLMSLEYRPSSSKLSAADYATIKTIINKDFYTLINQPGFTDLVTVQTILKTTYNIEP
jgi:hypothetical protein